MKKTSTILALMLMIVFSAGMVHAAIITLHFTGEITDVIDDQNTLGGAISVGDSFSTTLNFDAALVTDTQGDPDLGYYPWYSISGANIMTQINGFTFETNPASQQTHWMVWNDCPSGADRHTIKGFDPVADSTLSSVYFELLRLNFYDYSETAFSTDALPVTIDLASFGLRELIIQTTNTTGANFAITGTINAVPVPAAVWLLGSGLLGLVGLKRKFRNA